MMLEVTSDVRVAILSEANSGGAVRSARRYTSLGSASLGSASLPVPDPIILLRAPPGFMPGRLEECLLYDERRTNSS